MQFHPQLPLVFGTGQGQHFDSFWPVGNEFVIDRIRSLALGIDDDRQVYLRGPSRSGKSHLLAAACNGAAERGLHTVYLPAALINTAESLAGLDHLDLIFKDDLQLLSTDVIVEEALFGLVNGLRVLHGRLLLAADRSPLELSIGLPDLHTRLSWGAAYRLDPVPPERLREAVAFRAQRAGILIGDEVLDYLLSRFPRDPGLLFERVTALEHASLQTKRRITIPLARELFATR